jgi:hypothetical protein
MKASHLILAACLIAPALPARAQTRPPASTTGIDRPSLSGTWSLDRDISNDPTRAAFDEPADTAPRMRGRQGGGFGGGGGRGGLGGFGGSGGVGGDQADRTEPEPGTPDERARLKELTDLVRRSSNSLLIAHEDPSLTITDAQGRTHVFQTNGARDTHTLATATVTSTSHWDGSRLVTEYDLGSLGKLVSSYTALAASRQLVIRTRLEVPERQRTSLPELKLVYKLSAPLKPPSPPEAGRAAAYSAVGGGHLIQQVSPDGRYVTLEDRSRWEVHPRVRFQTADWATPVGATVRNARDEDGYTYQIVNTDEDEGVPARYLGRP